MNLIEGAGDGIWDRRSRVSRRIDNTLRQVKYTENLKRQNLEADLGKKMSDRCNAQLKQIQSAGDKIGLVLEEHHLLAYPAYLAAPR